MSFVIFADTAKEFHEELIKQLQADVDAIRNHVESYEKRIREGQKVPKDLMSRMRTDWATRHAMLSLWKNAKLFPAAEHPARRKTDESDS